MKSNIKNTILLIACCCVVGVGIGSIFIFGFNNNFGNGGDPIYNPGSGHVILEDGTDMAIEYRDSNVENNEARFTYLDVNESSHQPVTPSLTRSNDEVNILVIPVEFDEPRFDRYDVVEYTDEILESIEYTFNGDPSLNGENSYWESVSSYYKKSSYGNLNLNFDVTDPFRPNMSANDFLNLEQSSASGAGGSQEIITEALTNGITKNGELIDPYSSRYDYNNDGFIDGIWLIYNVMNTEEVHSSAQPFWAYTTNFLAQATDRETGENSIVGTRYANCALTFLYDDSSEGYDAHTIIHETGHMLGLDDYYSYDNNFGNYGYLGGIDMMDLNIGDHSSFSKYSLGWIEPNVFYQKEGTITLKPFEESGDALIIPSSYYNDSAFSEYLILEYKTPTGLNELDANDNYQNGYPLAFGNGLAIYHVDAKLAEVLYTQQSDSLYYSIENYLSENETSIPLANTSLYEETVFEVANSNTPSRSRISEDYALVRLLSKDRTLYSDSNKISRVGLTNRDLYQDGDVFGSEQIERFFDYDTFNNGTPINNLSIEVEEMNDEGITIHIKR